MMSRPERPEPGPVGRRFSAPGAERRRPRMSAGRADYVVLRDEPLYDGRSTRAGLGLAEYLCTSLFRYVEPAFRRIDNTGAIHQIVMMPIPRSEDWAGYFF